MALQRLVRNEYTAAGFSPGDVDTGAAIITGETARADNAEQVLEVLSHLAGDFVVSTAGPHVESILAARGSGLDTYSEHTTARVANLDIGGGTTNIAVYQHGERLGTACLDIGGRLVRATTHQIEAIAEPIARLAGAHGVRIAAGDPTNLDTLRTLAQLLPALQQGLQLQGFSIGTPFFVKYGRVRSMEPIAEALNAKVGMPEADRTCVSNIHSHGSNAIEVGTHLADLIGEMMKQQASGINLKT